MQRATLAGIATLLFAVAAAAASAGTPKATLDRHPPIPSTATLPPNLLYEQGAPAGTATAQSQSALVTRGRTLYDTHCITCHGADLRGVAGVPSLEHDGGAATDFFVRTGRMPAAMKVTQAVHAAPHFDETEIDALDAYVASRAASSVPIPRVRLDESLLQSGRKLFENNCQQCHGAAAEGATVGTGWIAVALYNATPTEVGEAIRVGPGLMPRFTADQLDARDIDAVATYVHYLTYDSPSYGGLTMDYLGPAAEGLVGGILGVGALFWVIFFTGTKADGTRLHEK